MVKKTNLKATLSNFQEKQRRAQLQKVKEAAKKNVLKKSTSSAKSRGKRPSCLATIPLAASDTVLLIGEGNFSFSRALFHSQHEKLAHLPPPNVTATTYDSEQACYEKYPDAKEIVQELREKGVTVLFGVDARKLGACKELKKRKWRRVIWNFPHAGKGISDQDRNILSNQILILDFLKSVAPLLEDGALPNRNAHKMRHAKTDSDDEGDDDSQSHDDEGPSRDPQMKERGTILITLRNGPPYTLWDVPRLAKKPPAPHISSISPSIPQPSYIQLRSFVFRQEDWPGYEHRITKGWVAGLGRGGKEGADRVVEDRTWEFCLVDT